MGAFEVVAIAIVVGAISGVITKYLDTAAGGKRAAAAAELRRAQERIRLLEAQVVEAHRQSEALQEQVAWQARMLETHATMTAQPSTEAPMAEVVAGRSRSPSSTT